MCRVRAGGLPHLEFAPMSNDIVNRVGVSQTQAIVLLEPGDDVLGFGEVFLFGFGDELIGRLAHFFFYVVEIGLK